MTEQKRSFVGTYGWLILLFLGALFVYAGWGWTYQLWDRYEVLPGNVMGSLLEGGGWLLPGTEAGRVPPLYYWITGLLVRGIGSDSAFVLRLPAMCSAAALVALTAGATARMTNRKTGWLAAGITGTGGVFAWQATRMTPALTGALFLVSGWILLYESTACKHRNRLLVPVAFLLFGLGFLTIGPAALVPPVAFGVFKWFEATDADGEEGLVLWSMGTLTFAVVAAVWLVPLAWVDGGSGLYSVFADPVNTFSPGDAAGQQPFWFYAEVLLLHFLPWTPFLFLVLPEVVRSVEQQPFLRMSVLFLAVYVLVLTIWSTKDAVVMLPVYPVLGVVTSIALERRFLRSRDRASLLLLVGGGLGLLFIGAAAVVVIRGPALLLRESYLRPLPVHQLVSAYSVAGVLLCSGFMMAGSAWKRVPGWLLGSTASGIAVLLLTVKLVVAPNLDARNNLQSHRPPAEAVQNLSLTWEKRDMIRTMTVNFQTRRGTENARVYYDTTSRDGRPESYRHRQSGTSRTVDRLKRTIHHSTLTGLEPDTRYYFIAGSPESGYSDEQVFRTLPENGELRFLVGGDQGTSAAFRKLNRVAARTDPHFALIGGDMAYADGQWRNTATWNAWHRIWNSTMKGSDGRMVPMVLALGNHEINTRLAERDQGNRYRLAPFYFHYFQQGEKTGYFGKTVGERLYVMTLDTGYVNSVEQQASWIRNELRRHRNSTFRIALYHRPMYPAVKGGVGVEKRMRTHWEPLFNESGLDVAFEHDGHVLKRTHRLKNGEMSEDGIPYLGEGAWGMTPRTPDPERSYIKTASGKRHVWAVTLQSDQMKLKAIGTDGGVLDALTIRRRSGSGSND